MTVFLRLWSRLKRWRRFPIGPITLRFKFERTVRVSAGALQRSQWHQTLTAPHLEQRGFADIQVASQRQPPASTGDGAGTAVIVGVGPGFGFALARRLVHEGFNLILVSRDAARLDPLLKELRGTGRQIQTYSADATDESAVEQLFEKVAELCGSPSLVVYSLQEFGPGATIDVELPAFESAWRHNCLGAFLVGRSAARLMKSSGKGSILLIGSTSSILGREGHLNLAVGKFGQRALSQVLAREMWPFGVHVAHVVIDADIAESNVSDTAGNQSNPDDIAFSILSVHQQPRTAWTSEIDIRPWNERFWEHC